MTKGRLGTKGNPIMGGESPDPKRVESYPHAYLVVGTYDYVKCWQFLADHVGPIESAEMAKQMPCRPFHHPQYGSCVAFYFEIGGRTVSKAGKKAALRRFRDRAREKVDA